MIASLGMYDRAETASANDRYWALIRDGLLVRGIAAPPNLTRGEAAYWPAWQSNSLVLSQTCGLPYRAKLHGQVTLIGTPDFGLPGCPAGHYNSVFLVRADDPRSAVHEFRDARFAYNEAMSQSGWAAPQIHAQGLGFQFRPALQSGGHKQSAQAVVEARADIAAMDALTFALCQRFDPFMANLRELARTCPTPVLPYIAAKGARTRDTFAAIAEAIVALSDQDRDTLSLRGIVAIAAEDYLSVPTPAPPEN
jgi:ABC-type phosphate/phosphonate transport system substrate-binding protein